MDPIHNKFTDIAVGIIVVATQVRQKALDALVDWVITERVEMLTGFFGDQNVVKFVSELGRRSKAISSMPFLQGLGYEGQAYWHPSGYLLYGYYKEIKVKKDCPGLQPWVRLRLGEDLWQDMRPSYSPFDVPNWPNNDHGNAYVKNIGNINMKHPNWGKDWFDGCYRTCFWLGQSVQGRGANKKASK